MKICVMDTRKTAGRRSTRARSIRSGVSSFIDFLPRRTCCELDRSTHRELSTGDTKCLINVDFFASADRPTPRHKPKTSLLPPSLPHSVPLSIFLSTHPPSAISSSSFRSSRLRSIRLSKRAFLPFIPPHSTRCHARVFHADPLL